VRNGGQPRSGFGGRYQANLKLNDESMDKEPFHQPESEVGIDCPLENSKLTAQADDSAHSHLSSAGALCGREPSAVAFRLTRQPFHPFLAIRLNPWRHLLSASSQPFITQSPVAPKQPHSSIFPSRTSRDHHTKISRMFQNGSKNGVQRLVPDFLPSALKLIDSPRLGVSVLYKEHAK
jgi:hypothetical protein